MHLGHDVLAIDMDEDISSRIFQIMLLMQFKWMQQMKHALRTLGLRNFDVAVVTIGSNIQASVMITLIS